MTVTSEISRKNYTGNGSTKIFAYNFLIFVTGDLKVYLDGVLKTETTHYTVSGAGSASGGNVTFGTEPASSVAITILRELTFTQSTDFVENDDLPAATVEEAYDRSVMLGRQNDERLDRAVVLPVESTLTGIEFPAPVASKLIGWNSAADALELVTLAESDVLEVISAKGDIIQGNASAAGARLARGAAGSILYIASDLLAYLAVGSGNQVLSVSGGNPAWAAPEVQLGVAQEFTKTQNFNLTTLTDASTVAWDCSANQVCKVTLGGNRTLGNPTNVVDGATYILIVKQPGSGGPRTLSYASQYKWPADAAPTLSTTANYVDLLCFVADGTNMLGQFNLDMR